MTDIFVVGVSMTPFGKFLDKSVKALTAEAVTAALQDAGCDKDAIGAAFFANAAQSAMEGQYMVGGEIALRAMGFTDLPIFNVENACASASTAFNLACTQLRAGECDIALAVGAEKMYSHDKARTFEVFNGAWDVHEVDSLTQNLLRLAEGIETPAGAFYVDGASVLYLVGSVMDWREDDFAAGFVFDNPNAKGACGCGESFTV